MRRASASPMPLEAPVTSATSCAMESPPRRRWVVSLSTEQRALTASGRLAMTGASMALLTPAEFTEAVSALAAHYGVERLRERLARLNALDRKSTRLNSSHANISYAVFCLKKKKRSETSPTAHSQSTA